MKEAEINLFLLDYMALCMYHKLMITSCCGKPFLKDVKDEETLRKFMDELRDERRK